jgi:hypothetical protein
VLSVPSGFTNPCTAGTTVTAFIQGACVGVLRCLLLSLAEYVVVRRCSLASASIHLVPSMLMFVFLFSAHGSQPRTRRTTR